MEIIALNSAKPPLLKLNLFLFSTCFLITFVVAPWYVMNHGFHGYQLFWLVLCFSLTNLSITAGYHRLWSHKTYQANFVVRVLFALGGAFAVQNSILHWSSDHRRHHKHVDNNEKDPYSAKRGLWFSHLGWMLRNYNQATYEDYSNCRDLQKDPVVMWQHKHYVALALLTNIAIPLLLGLWYQDIWGMLLFVGVVRLFLSHHTTFFINSLAHYWGKATFTSKNSARDNPVLAIFTFGEGYHNFHHLFENDYRNGIRWWHYDPTKWLIFGLNKIGLASQLRRTPAFKIERAKLAMMKEKASIKMAHLPNREELFQQLQMEFDALLVNLKHYYALKKEIVETKAHSITTRYELAIKQVRFKQLSLELESQRVLWKRLITQYA